jgi:hypothetical protein
VIARPDQLDLGLDGRRIRGQAGEHRIHADDVALPGQRKRPLPFDAVHLTGWDT